MNEGLQTALSIPRRMDVIRSQKERGGQVAAVFPIHYPRSLFRAFGILPVEVWGPPGADTCRGGTHLQPYVCGIVRNGLSFLLSGGLDAVDFIVVPHGCDSLQGLGSILLDFIQPEQTVLPIYLPRQSNEAAVRFLASEFGSIHQKLAQATGCHPEAPDLMQAIRREEAADRLSGELFKNRTYLALSNLEFYQLVRSREFLPAEEFAALAQAALGQRTACPQSGTPVILSGIVPEPMELLEAVTRAGAVVVADDLACSGRRLYPDGKSREPFRRMAERILEAPPDSTRGSSVEERLRHLQSLAENSGAKGIIFYQVKFCEPEQFYLPQLRSGLLEAGVRSVAMEGDLDLQLARQLTTRIEAFLETIT